MMQPVHDGRVAGLKRSRDAVLGLDRGEVRHVLDSTAAIGFQVVGPPPQQSSGGDL